MPGFPLAEPFDSGLLAVGDGNQVYYEQVGNPEGIPGVLVHGRHDLGGPVKTAWDLAKAWPGCELVIVEDSGHTGSQAFTEAIRSAVDRIAGL